MVSYFIGNFSTNRFLMIRQMITMAIVRDANKRKTEVSELNASEVLKVTKCCINITNNH